VGKPELNLIGDSSFQGLKQEGLELRIPHKKPRSGELSEEQKKYNRELARIRARIEHVFGCLKRFRVLRDVFRSPSEGFRDSIFKIVCGLYNYVFNRKLEQASSRSSQASN
jgi:hypothetical protein